MRDASIVCSLAYRIPEELLIDLELEDLTLTELLEVETALVSFMLSVLLLRCCHVIVEVSRLSLYNISLCYVHYTCNIASLVCWYKS